MNFKKYLIYILTFLIIIGCVLPITTVYATTDEPNVNAPVALLMDSRYWKNFI